MRGKAYMLEHITHARTHLHVGGETGKRLNT
jgi:hypothetical protein